MKLEHIGIAVKDLEKSNKIYSLLLGEEPFKVEKVLDQKTVTSFFKAGEPKIELLAAMDEDSVIAKFIEKKGEGIHHLAFDVPNIEVAIQDMKDKGFTVLYDQPRRGADNKLITFLHPKDCNGVLVELCQSIE